MMRKSITLITWILALQLIGFALGMMTESNLVSWYQTLPKSSLTPPGVVFAIVWPILYVLIAIVGFIVWENRHHPKYKLLLKLFVIQLILNWLWTPLFFQFHLVGVSFFWLLALVVVVGTLIYKANSVEFKISLILFPYFIWLLFAAYLNGYIWLQWV